MVEYFVCGIPTARDSSVTVSSIKITDVCHSLPRELLVLFSLADIIKSSFDILYRVCKDSN